MTKKKAIKEDDPMALLAAIRAEGDKGGDEDEEEEDEYELELKRLAMESRLPATDVWLPPPLPLQTSFSPLLAPPFSPAPASFPLY